MASGDRRPAGATKLGAAVLALVSPPARSVKAMIAYILSPRTGASTQSVARQLKVRQATVRSWEAGKRPPSGASQRKIKVLYERFYRLNNARKPGRNVNTAELKVRNISDPAGIVVHEGRRGDRPLNPCPVEASTQRQWGPVLDAKTPLEAYDAFVAGVIGPSPLPSIPDYLDFLDGDYTIT